MEKITVGVDTAAEMLGLGRDVTYRLILSNQIVSFKVGTRRLVPIQAIREYVERQTAEAVGSR